MARSFVTNAGGAELLSLSYRGTLLDGSPCAGFHVLAVASSTALWPESETIAPVLIDVPASTCPPAFVPRAPGSWSIAERGGSATEVVATLAAPLVLDAAAAFNFDRLALATGTAPTSRLLAVLECGFASVSARQRVTVTRAGFGFGPAAAADGRAFATAEGMREFLSLALHDRLLDGSGPPGEFAVDLLAAAFTFPAHPAGWPLKRADLAPHVLADSLLVPPPRIARAPSAWSIAPDSWGEQTVALPAAPLRFTYSGAEAVEVGACAVRAGAEPIVVLPFLAVHELGPGTATVELGFATEAVP